MAKTITIDLPEELEKRMNKFKDVEWSEVCKQAIEDYIAARNKIGPGTFGYHHELFTAMGGYRS